VNGLQQEIIFVLVRPLYPGNIGSVARVLKNFGFRRLVLISPECELSDEAYKMAMHARDLLENINTYSSIEEFIETEQVNYVIGTTARLGGDKNPKRNAILSQEIREHPLPMGKIAILFGNEETGLTNEEIEFCDMLITIPTSEIYPVMNISHALAVIAYELALALGHQRKLPYRSSTPNERKILIKYLHSLADLVLNDLDENRKRIYKRILENWVGRAFLTGREVHSLIGFTRRILARLKNLRHKKYGD